MKKLLLLLLVFPFAFSSCSDDDEDYPVSELLGSWTIESIVGDVKTNDAAVTKEIKEDIAKSLNYAKLDFVFAENGKVTITDKISTLNGTYSVKGNSVIVTYDGDSERFAISSDKLVLRYNETEYYQEEYPNVKVSQAIEVWTWKKK